MTFDSIFFIAFGIFTLTMGLLNKGNAFWTSTQYDGLKNSLGKKYSRTINITMGIISIFIGIGIARYRN